jgi:hypothetical protein
LSLTTKHAFVSIIFSAMYIESVLNEIIFLDQQFAKQYEEYFSRPKQSMAIDLYDERESFEGKLHLILGHYGLNNYEQDAEFIDLTHLMTIRGSLVHLKPVGQLSGGEPERKISKAALNYLHHGLKIIRDPFEKGVFWTDVLMNKEVADWSVKTVVDGVNWMFTKTHDGKLGNFTLSWHSQLMGVHS